MELYSCRSCYLKAELKCGTCDEFYCINHAYSCKINPLPHILINWPPACGSLFEDLKGKLFHHLKMIESSSTEIIKALVSLKRKSIGIVQEHLKFIDDLEKDFESNSQIGQNQNTIINKYLKNPSEDLKDVLLTSITFTNFFNEILQIINQTLPINFNTDFLLKNEKINPKPSTSDSSIEISEAVESANYTFFKLIEFKKEFASNVVLSNIFHLMKMEQVTYRETVTSFNLPYENCTSIKGVKIQCDSLSLFPKLNSIILERLTPDQVESLLPNLKIPKKVKHFTLDRCIDIGPLELKELKKKLENTNLKSFSFKLCNCLSEGINLVVSKLAPNRLTHLMLPGNLLGFEGCKGLASCLHKFTCLTHLNLRNNDLTVREMNILWPALNKLSKLKHLDIAINELKIHGIKKLLKGIEKSPFLASLDISSNKLADEDDESIKVMFKEDFNELKLLETLVLDMTVKKDQLDVLREALPKFTNIFISNSDIIQSLPKNMNN